MKIKKVKRLAKEQAEISCSWINFPQIGDYINPDIDYWGLGEVVNEDNRWEYFQLICEYAVSKDMYNGILSKKQLRKIEENSDLYDAWQESVTDYICDYAGQMKEWYEDL